jgi:hypothetical protein
MLFWSASQKASGNVFRSHAVQPFTPFKQLALRIGWCGTLNAAAATPNRIIAATNEIINCMLVVELPFQILQKLDLVPTEFWEHRGICRRPAYAGDGTEGAVI